MIEPLGMSRPALLAEGTQILLMAISKAPGEAARDTCGIVRRQKCTR